MDHSLIIKSLHDAKAECPCGWSFSFTGKMTREKIRQEFLRHLPDDLSRENERLSRLLNNKKEGVNR